MKQRKTRALKVGRAGHDPATYGLKGPLSTSTSQRENQTAPSSDETREPTVAQFGFGDHVVVVDGLARGLVGRTIGLAKVTFGSIPVWAVEFPPPLGVRSIRQDFLRLEAA